MVKKGLQKYKELPVQVKASFWFLMCGFLSKGISMITTPIFTRIFTTEEYGQFSVFNSWYSLVAVIVTLNLYSGVYAQGLVKFEEYKHRFSSAMQGFMLTLLLIYFFIYIAFHNFWNDLFSLTTIQMLAMFFLIWSYGTRSFWAAEQRNENRYRLLVMISLATTICNPLLGVILVMCAKDKVTARIMGMVVVNLIFYAWCFWAQVSKGKTLYDPKIWKYAFVFNLPLIPHYLSGSVLSSADRIMISKMTGDGNAGIYNLAYNVAMIMGIFNSALLQTIEPWLYKKIKERKVEVIAGVAYPAFVLVAIVNIMLIAFAPEIVAIFAPVKYYAAIYVIPPVAMSVYFMFAYSFFAVFEFYYEQTKYITLATTISAVANIVLNYVFIRLFGYYAAGYTTLLCYLLQVVFHYCFMRILCRRRLEGNYPYSTRVLLMITVSFMAVGFIFLATYSYPVLRYVSIGIIMILLFAFRRRIIQAIKGFWKLKKGRI